jgi:hypothetical protein
VCQCNRDERGEVGEEGCWEIALQLTATLAPLMPSRQLPKWPRALHHCCTDDTVGGAENGVGATAALVDIAGP